MTKPLENFYALVLATEDHFLMHEWVEHEQEMTIGQAVLFMTSPPQMTDEAVPLIAAGIEISGDWLDLRLEIRSQLLEIMMANPKLIEISKQRACLFHPAYPLHVAA